MPIDPSAPKRVCVIGSSYVGALKKAYSTMPAEQRPDYEFFFFASAGKSFSRMTVQDGLLTHVDHATAENADVRAYDIAVVYGDFPTPGRVSRFAQDASRNLYSEQLRQARLQTFFQDFTAYRLASSLVRTGGPAVYLLSKNPHASETILPDAEQADAIAIIGNGIASATYVPMPKDLFADDGRPHEQYYLGSLTVTGAEPDRGVQPRHHLDHINEAGGRLVLTTLLDRFRAAAQS